MWSFKRWMSIALANWNSLSMEFLIVQAGEFLKLKNVIILDVLYAIMEHEVWALYHQHLKLYTSHWVNLLSVQIIYTTQMQILSFVFHLWPRRGHFSGTLNSWAKCAGNFQSMLVACGNLTELIAHWSVKVCSCIFNSILCWMPSGCYTGIDVQLAASDSVLSVLNLNGF